MAFAKTFDFRAEETRIYAAWEAAGCFRAGAGARSGAPSYCIVIPPPNVTGALHMGHALNATVQDILVRWHRMRGFDTLWQPGMDHAGIATQMVVERALAHNGEPDRRTLGRDAFLEKVWAWKERYGGAIGNQFRRLGASCDWSRERFTLDARLSHAVRQVFVALFEEGLIYRDRRLVNWDPHFETAISDLEVQQCETHGTLWHIRYPFADGDGYLVVATTRPETMLGDTGVAVHPEDPRHRAHIGRQLRLPLVGRPIPVVADRHADPETGSGAVKVTPAHDFNDFAVGRRAGLPAVQVMDTKARMAIRDNAAFLEGAEAGAELEATLALHGLDRHEARAQIVQMLEARGLLERAEPHDHVVPHGDRSGVPTEPYLTDQWFVDAARLAEPALEAVQRGETRFHPAQWETTYYRWLEHIEPWCISRQLWWGHRIPVWYGPDGNAFAAMDEAGAAAAAARHYGREVALVQDEDVLDTWFSSALWPFSTLGWPAATPELARYYPTAVLVTAFDIIFFWVARMMMVGLHFQRDDAGAGVVPFRDVYVHAIVRDEQGQKMSKSLGNVLDPLALVEEFGADAVRFALAAMAAKGRDIRLSRSRIEGYRNFATKIWNAARFAALQECRPVADFDPAVLQDPVHRWMVDKLATLRAELDAALGDYRFDEAARVLQRTVWGGFCDWYLEFVKPVLREGPEAARAETRATVAWCLDRILVLTHPFMPFVTEALWEAVPHATRATPLVHAPWPEEDARERCDAAVRDEMDRLVTLIEGIRSLRSELGVPAAARPALTIVPERAAAGEAVAPHAALLMQLARVAEPVIAGAPPPGAAALPVEGATAYLHVAGLVDLPTERARLEKRLAAATQEVDRIERRLGDATFLARAPAAVIEESRARRAGAREEQQRVEASLERLAIVGERE